MSDAIRYQAVCDIGSVRANNEDMAIVAHRLVRDCSVSGDITKDVPVAFAVADGMGGYEGGELASEITCRSFLSFMDSINNKIEPAEDNCIITSIKNWAIRANNLVNETASLRPELAEMGTTFISLIFIDGKCFLLNIGDSRCYRMRDGILKQISTDHSERQRTGNSEVPSNIIYNYLGRTPREFFSDVTELTHLSGDSYILCSDGLSDLLDDDTIEHYADSVMDLLAQAKKAGGRDNITIIRMEI